MNLSVDTASRLPIYQQLAQQIREAIARGELRPGAALPSVRQLSRDLDRPGRAIERIDLLTNPAPDQVALERPCAAADAQSALEAALAEEFDEPIHWPELQ